MSGPDLEERTGRHSQFVPRAMPDATWSSLDGVLTTNLYGLPDRGRAAGAL